MKPARVLIVDDSSVMRKIVGRSLRQAGLEVQEVLEASNGSEALTVARENSLDLILSDINMPLMDGLEFVRQLRCIEAAQHIPVIKARIAGLADGCALSVPTVIIGRDFALYSLAKGEHYEVIFLFEDKPFCVTLDLHG